MNRKQLILLLAVLLILGSAGLVLINQHKESWAVHESKMGDKVFPNFQPNAVAGIRIKGDSTLNVVRKKDAWGVQERWDYPASVSQISDLLIKLRDLTVVESDEVGAADLGRVNLKEPGKGTNSGTLVEFTDRQGKVMEAVLLGKKHLKQMGENHSALAHSDPDGRYIRLPSDPRFVLLVSNALSVLEPRPEAWFSRDFFAVERIKSASRTGIDPTNNWRISRDTETSSWVLADNKPGEMLETEKLLQIANGLQYPRFVDVVATNAPTKTGLEKPAILTIETFDQFTYTIKVGTKATDETVYVTVNVVATALENRTKEATKRFEDKLKREQSLSSWIYVMNLWMLEPFMRERAQLLQGYVETTQVNSTPSSVAAPVTQTSDGPTGAQTWTPRVIK